MSSMSLQITADAVIILGSQHYRSLPYYYNNFYSSYSLGKAENVDGDQLDPFGHTIG